MPGIDRVESEYVPEESTISLRILAVKNNVRSIDHKFFLAQ